MQIESLENELGEIQEQLSASDFYQQPGERVAEVTARLNQIEDELAERYQRWEALEAQLEPVD